MGKKYKTTQELVNGFPDWTKIRQDGQSVGQSLINVISKNIETIDTELFRGAANLSLTTANVAEIDLVYRFSLPERFEFNVDNPNQLQPIPLSPTVSGRIGNEWFSINESQTGSIKEFWYNSVPTRIDRSNIYSGVNHLIIDGNSESYTFSNLPDLFLSNNLLIDVSSVRLLEEAPENEQKYLQARIRITGTTWKGTKESEEISWIYSDQKRSSKSWTELEKIEAVDFPASGNILVHSHGFNQRCYIDPFQNISQYEHSRDNLTTFWSIEESCWVSGMKLLETKTYAATRAIDVLSNRVDTIPTREWELLDSEEATVDVLDIAPIPFSQRAWAISQSGLYLYDLDFDQPSHKALSGRTVSPLAQIVTQRDYVTREEDVEVELRFVRPTKTVIKHRLTIEFPDGLSMGVLTDGSLVPTTSDYWVNNVTESRLLRQATDFTLTDIGDHLFTLEVQYYGNEIQTDKRIVRVAAKRPLAQFDLFELIGTTASGIDIDHQQRLLIIDDNQDVHELIPHYDTMLIDFAGKELVFRESYDEVKVQK